MIITKDSSIRLISREPSDNKFAEARFEALNKCVAALTVNLLTAVEFGLAGVTFKFKQNDILTDYVNTVLVHEDFDRVNASTLIMIYLQENGVNLHISDPAIDILLFNFDNQDIDLDANDHYIGCEMIQRNVGEPQEPDQLYDIIDSAIKNHDHDTLHDAIDAIRTMYDEEDDDDECPDMKPEVETRIVNEKQKTRSKKKNKIAKASRKRNRKK